MFFYDQNLGAHFYIVVFTETPRQYAPLSSNSPPSASLIAQLVKNRLQCRRPQLDSWVRKFPWRWDRLPTPIFLGFSCGSAGKESACNAGDLSSIPGLGRSAGEREHLLTLVFWPGEFRGLYSPWGHKELDMTKPLSLSAT